MANVDSEGRDEVEQQRLRETVGRGLYYQRIDEAEQAAGALLEADPDSTTTWELWGDVLLARGKTAEASEAFEKAIKIEPANVDAERKYAAIQLELGERKRQQELLASGTLEELRGALQKEPGTAATRSAFFPGLGQVYNGDYEKGLVMLVLGFILLIPAVRQVVEWISPQQAGSTLSTIFGYLGIFGFLSLYLFGIYDAYRHGRESASDQTVVPPPTTPNKVD